MDASRPQPSRSTRHRAFRWHPAQPAAIGVSALLGAWSGWTFARGSLPFAWMMFLFGFVWVLMISLVLSMFLAYRTRIVRGDWWAAMHLGFASVFPLTTVYLALVAALTWNIDLEVVYFPNERHALSKPDFLRQVPVLYLCSLVIGVISGPLYARAAPSRRPQSGGSPPKRAVEDIAAEQIAAEQVEHG